MRQLALKQDELDTEVMIITSQPIGLERAGQILNRTKTRKPLNRFSIALKGQNITAQGKPEGRHPGKWSAQ